MKKYWIYNILITVALFVLYLVVNYQIYGSRAEIIFDRTLLAISLIHLCISLFYALKNRKKHTIETGIMVILAVGMILLLILFIFNASFWNTDTGSFRNIQLS